jgi:4-hydroxybenzoate polyprenyltransferase
MDRGIGKLGLAGNKKAFWLDYFFLPRPMILIPVSTFFLLGVYHGKNATENSIVIINLLYGILSFTALIGAIYIINQITDKKTDLANNKLFLIPREIISVKAARIEAVILIIISFFTAILFLSKAFIIILLLSLLLGLAYSIEPFRFKKRPILDVASNAVGNGILNIFAGWIVTGYQIAGWEILLPYPFAVASVHLVTTIADIEGDRKNNLKTSGVVLGQRKGIIISVILMGLAVITALLVNNKTALSASLFSLPFYFVPVLTKTAHLSQSRILFPAKISTLIFSVVAGVLFRFYLPCLAVIVLLTYLYYKFRFQIAYPSLK